jgi:hypothetical protein
MVERDAALERALSRSLATPVRVRARRPSPYGSSFPLEELDVETDTGERIALVVKEVTAGALLPDARRARAGTRPDPARELRAYDLLERARIGAPVRRATLHENGRAWLALERVEGDRLDERGDDGAWHAVARWLADAHQRLAALGETAPWLPAWRPPDRLEALAEPLAAAEARVAALPSGVIHGELYPANVLISGTRVCAIDWETIARGPALLDLAALTAGRWDEPGEPLAESYRATLPDPPPADALLRDLDACRLLVAARWLTVPPGWTPPREQARDWLADAELVAGRLAA